MTVSVKSEPREDGREQRDRNPAASIRADHPVGTSAQVRIGAARHYPPCQTGFFMARAKNQKPPFRQKARYGAGLRPSRNFFTQREGRAFFFAVLISALC